MGIGKGTVMRYLMAAILWVVAAGACAQAVEEAAAPGAPYLEPGRARVQPTALPIAPRATGANTPIHPSVMMKSSTMRSPFC